MTPTIYLLRGLLRQNAGHKIRIVWNPNETSHSKTAEEQARRQTPWRGFLIAVLSSVFITLLLAPFQTSLSSTTVALTFLLVVLFVALSHGSRPALFASLLSVACFNFFFLPPLYTFTITDSRNWVAFGAFLVTALTVGQLSARANVKADEAERQRQEIERLYTELKLAVEKISEAEAIRRSEQLKSALLDAVTHDLRTPLTSIKASVTMLLAERATAESVALPTALDEEGQMELLQVINEETDRLNHFIENMVELARIEAGALRLEQRWSSVEEMIASAVRRAQSVLHSHPLQVTISDAMPLARVDARAITEILYTLLDNAAKYSPVGSPIWIQATTRDDERGLIQLSVLDEGPGIPVALREKVFDKFFRVTSSATPPLPRSSGLGMGLAIARGIALAHGGQLWIEDGRNGKGARFILTLPIGDNES